MNYILHRTLFLLFSTLPLIAYSQPTLEGFTEDVIETNLKTGIGIEFDKNGQGYVWDMEGKVLVLSSNNTLLPTPFLDITEEVSKWLDIGMVGFTLHPDFPSTPYVYALYSVDRYYEEFFGTIDYDSNQTYKNTSTFGRIARFTADAESDYQTIIPNSKVILLGNNETDGFPILYDSHGVGSLVFGNDGSLLASLGDSASSFGEDVGSHWSTYWEDGLKIGIIQEKDNVGAFRSQMLTNLAGKIIRIDAETGLGLPSNPFYVDGQPDIARSKIWTLGTRNGYRFAIKPETGSHFQSDGSPGTIILGDVGYSGWEEINVVDEAGLNLGWPIYEGGSQTKYASMEIRSKEYMNSADCENYYEFSSLLGKDNINKSAELLNPCNNEIIDDAPTFYHHRPIFAYRNSNEDSSAISFVSSFDNEGEAIWTNTVDLGLEAMEGDASVGGLFYESGSYPESYHGKYFHVDYSGWIKIFSFDSTFNKIINIEDFYVSDKNISCIALNPKTGEIIAVAKNGVLHIISYTENAKPKIEINHSSLYGNSPLNVTLDASNTEDEDQPLIYRWSRNGLEIGNKAVLSLTLEGNDKTVENVMLKVTDNLGAFSEEKVEIHLNNNPPKVSIITPIDKSFFPNEGSHIINFRGTASDTDDDDNALKYSWEMYLHHNEHYHYDRGFSGSSTDWYLSPLGCLEDDYWYRIKLIGTDPSGLSSSDEIEIFPNCDFGDYPIIELTTWVTSVGTDLNAVFNNVASISTIELQRSIEDKAYELVDSFEIDEYTEVLNHQDVLAEKGNIKYRMKLVNEGNWFYSNISEVTFPSEERISIFPNPASSYLSIRIEKVLTENLTFDLYNIEGIKIMEKIFEAEKDMPFERRIDLFSLSRGIYFFKINTGLNNYSGRVVLIPR